MRLPFIVAGVYSSGDVAGKVASDVERPMFAEYSTFLRYLAPRLHPLIRHRALVPAPATNDYPSAAADGDMYQFATLVRTVAVLACLLRACA